MQNNILNLKDIYEIDIPAFYGIKIIVESSCSSQGGAGPSNTVDKNDGSSCSPIFGDFNSLRVIL
jgi:hypothetical protein